MKVSGNTILITGGSAGIGLAFAKRFLELENQVIVTGRNQEKLDQAKAELPGVETIQCDVANVDQIFAARDEICHRFPNLNVLMNNAGIFRYLNVTRSTDDLLGLTSEVEINFNGLIRTTSVFMDQLQSTKGTIINVSSGLAFVPLQCAPVYNATKAAVHSYTIALRQQLADSQVEVVELMPPAIKTRLTEDLPDDAGFQMLTTEQLVSATEAALRAGKEEIRPGQSNQLHWMSRIAPGFIRGQLAKGSKDLIPN